MSEKTSDKAADTATAPANIPPENLPEELLPVYDWYKSKGKDHILAAALALVVVVVVLAIVKYRDNQNAEASYALMGADGVESFEGLNAKYARTAVAPVISIRLAKAYYDAGRYAEAAETYGVFAQKNRKHVLAPQALLGQATALEAEASVESGAGNTDGATAKLSQARDIYAVLADDTASPVYAEAMMGHARCLAAMGDKAAAGDLLDRLVIEKKDTRWEELAENLRGVIDRFEGFKSTSVFDKLTAIEAPAAAEATEAAAAEEVVPATESAAEAAPAAEPPAAPAEAAPAPAAPAAAEEAPAASTEAAK